MSGMDRARRIGLEAAEMDEQTTALNASLERAAAREKRAIEHARFLLSSDKLDVAEFEVADDASVDYVDAGYWVHVRVFVDADDVEEEG